jgi:hypothetical protein
MNTLETNHRGQLVEQTMCTNSEADYSSPYVATTINPSLTHILGNSADLRPIQVSHLQLKQIVEWQISSSMSTKVEEIVCSGKYKKNRFDEQREVYQEISELQKQSICLSEELFGEYPFALVEKNISSVHSVKLHYTTFLLNFFDQHRGLNSKIITSNDNKKQTMFRKLGMVMLKAMSLQYYYNQIHDKKGGVINHKARARNRKVAKQLAHFIYIYIKRNFEPEVAGLIIKKVKRIIFQVEKGQSIEKLCNLYPSYKQPNPEKFKSLATGLDIDHTVVENCLNEILSIVPELHIKRSFLQLYLNRVYLIGAYMYQAICDLVVDLLNIKDPIVIKKVRAFAGHYGMMMQIVNDITDFVPDRTAAKTEADVMSDLKGRNVTLPILMHLVNRPNSEMEMLLKEKHVNWEDHDTKSILDEMIEAESLQKAKKIAETLALRAAEYLEDISDQKKILMLQNMCGIAFSNKHFLKLEELYPNFIIAHHQELITNADTSHVGGTPTSDSIPSEHPHPLPGPSLYPNSHPGDQSEVFDQSSYERALGTIIKSLPKPVGKIISFIIPNFFISICA